MKTNTEILDKLFDLTVENFIKKLEDKEVSSADMANILRLLKDNDITFDPSSENSKVSKLVDSLPELPEANVVPINK